MRIKFSIKPQTPFGSPLLGETLFGQLCWACVHLYGTERLETLLEGYTQDSPFLVVSDALPSGFLPLPTMPSHCWEKAKNADVKALKKRHWISIALAQATPFKDWQKKGISDKELGIAFQTHEDVQAHNAISRLTSTTGKGDFAPYLSEQKWFHPDALYDIYAVFDERLSQKELEAMIRYVGETGFGKDASIGLGKFSVENIEALPALKAGKCFMALASIFPTDALDKSQTYYRLKTHFGRHGADLAQSANPFKKPILLAERGAYLTFTSEQTIDFAGQGIGGVSLIDPKTVHQAYAPLILIA